MKLTYDPKYNIAYLKVGKRCGDVQTVHISESLNMDLSPDGSLYGIELLNANKQLFEKGEASFIFENKVSKKSKEVSFA
jgi:uncharacterized protein YuzE